MEDKKARTQSEKVLFAETRWVEFICNIGFSLILLRYFGLQGIAFATVIAFFIQKIILIVYNKKALGVSISDYLDVNKYILYSLLLYGSFALSLFFSN